MKRLILALMVMMLMVGCQPSIPQESTVVVDGEKDRKPNDTTKQPVQTSSEAEVITQTKPVDNMEVVEGGWDLTAEDFAVPFSYEPLSYEADAPDYTWKADLSDLHNAGQYSGFSQGQLDRLNENGFVVLKESDNWPYGMMHHGYEEAEYSFNPVFISSDIVLHMYRTYYNESMQALELLSYKPSLEALTGRLTLQVSDAYDQASDSVKEDLKYVYAYLAVASELLGMPTETPEEVATMVAYELDKINAHEGYNPSLVFDKKVDYSQYLVRGHYTLHEELEDYFRTMMWYGQSGFQMTDNGEVIYSGVTRASMLSNLILSDAENVTDWNSIYTLTKLYSGNSDDLNIFDMKAFMLAVYGDEQTFDHYVDQDFRARIDDLIWDLRAPEIIGRSSELPTGYDFRLMGQRFTLDSYVMQNLMMPILRPVPTAYDVMTAMGSQEAEEILYDYYPTNQKWTGYDQALADMKTTVETFERWQSNLYNGWLWAIQANLQVPEDKSGLPIFMQNRAWDQKNVTAALGSYAELKHDNILYSKQPVAERGGDWFTDQEYHYVEPNPELYNRLLSLAAYTKANLSLSDQVDPAMIQPLDYMTDLLEVLRDVSIKELEGRTVTDEEFKTMRSIGGYIDMLQYAFRSQLYDKGIHVEMKSTSALVADVATVDSASLEVATGMPYEIYVVAHVNDVTFLTKGYVFSFYEFLSEDRLTDEDWEQMIGYAKNEEWGHTEYTGPAYLMTDVMPWTETYVSKEANKVTTEMMELVWGE